MQRSLQALQEELIRLKHSGVRAVRVEEASLQALRKSVQASRQEIPLSENKESVLEEEIVDEKKVLPEPPQVILPEGDKRFRWDWLRDRVLGCSVCQAHLKPGKKVVFGVGDIDADIFFCGEAPGAEEEAEGEPFGGEAGQLLTKIIQAMGLRRESVYMANIMNWRPQMPTEIGSRPPTEEEMNFCLPYLRAQVEVVQPKVIVALGATAVNGLLGPNKKRRMGDVRGQFVDFMGIPLMITFHPSYLLRNSTLRTKRQVWEDMLKVMQALKMPISEKQEGYFRA